MRIPDLFPSLSLKDKDLRGLWFEERAFIGLAGSSGLSSNPALFHATTREKRQGDALRFKNEYPKMPYYLITTHLPKDWKPPKEINDVFLITDSICWERFLNTIHRVTRKGSSKLDEFLD